MPGCNRRARDRGHHAARVAPERADWRVGQRQERALRHHAANARRRPTGRGRTIGLLAVLAGNILDQDALHILSRSPLCRDKKRIAQTFKG